MVYVSKVEEETAAHEQLLNGRPKDRLPVHVHAVECVRDRRRMWTCASWESSQGRVIHVASYLGSIIESLCVLHAGVVAIFPRSYDHSESSLQIEENFLFSIETHAV